MKKTKKLSLEEIKDNFTAIEKDELISIKAGSGSNPGGPGGSTTYTYYIETITDPTFNQLFSAIQNGDVQSVQAGTYVNENATNVYLIDEYYQASPTTIVKAPHEPGYITPSQLQAEFGNSDTGVSYASSYFSVIGELASKQNTGISEGNYYNAYAADYDHSLIDINTGNNVFGTHPDPSFAMQQAYLQANFTTAPAGEASTPSLFGTLVSHNYDLVTSLVNHSGPGPGDVVLVTGYNEQTGMYTYDDPHSALYGQQAPISSFNVANTVAVAVPAGASK